MDEVDENDDQNSNDGQGGQDHQSHFPPHSQSYDGSTDEHGEEVEHAANFFTCGFLVGEGIIAEVG